MTVPRGNIVFNSLTGSDTQASGLGPVNAVYGAGASTTAGSSVVTGINTSGVTVGDLLWVMSSSGNQFSIIASVDSSTQVTCDDNFDNTESGITWAIGGKRATFDNVNSRNLFSTFSNNYAVVETETDQSLSSQINRPGGFGGFRLKGNDKTVSCEGNHGAFVASQSSSFVFCNFKFMGSAGNTATACTGGYIRCEYCVFGEKGSSNNFKSAVKNGAYASSGYLFRCKLYGQGNTVGYGLWGSYYAAGTGQVVECSISDFQYGVYLINSAGGTYNTVIRSIFSNCQGGVYSNANLISPQSCIFHDIVGDAIYLMGTTIHTTRLLDPAAPFADNIFINVGGYLMRWGGYGLPLDTYMPNLTTQYENYYVWYQYNSPAGNLNLDFPTRTLSVQPFLDPSSGDFNFSKGLYNSWNEPGYATYDFGNV